MPDWSYRTIFRPLLFRLPLPLARDLCLGFMGQLARLPLGSAVIDFLGHMRPDPRLQIKSADLSLAGPVVLGPHLDPRLLAPRALARFGFGMIEIGPIAEQSSDASSRVHRQDNSQSLWLPDEPPAISAQMATERLAAARLTIPVIARLAPGTQDVAAVAAQLAPHVAAYSVESADQVAVAAVHHPVLLCIAADIPMPPKALPIGICGVIVDGRIRDPAGGWLVGRAAHAAAVATVRRLRDEHGSELPIIAGGAVDPEGAVQLLAAGATAVQIDAGVVFAGPGLPKRVNEAVLFARCADQNKVLREGTPTRSAGAPVPTTWEQPHAAAMSWFWALLLGIAMFGGGLLALGIACTRVVLPYDEQYLGMTAAELTQRVNPRLLSFMAHDRVTLAGTMLAIGIQYLFLAWCGIRRGLHWAKLTLVASAFAGFGTFFLFLGFGYFDPFHAFVTAILFQFLLLAFQGRLKPAERPPPPNLADDWRWRLAQWGQLLLIIEAAAVMTAGVTICCIGSSSVFVPEDLEFMSTTAEHLRSANPRLVPVVAHDRASFGGMLLSVGIATLLPALWGVRQGETWLWWMLAIAGSVGYVTTLIIHLHVGYTSLDHLAPAVAGLGLLWLGLALLFPYMRPPPHDHYNRWQTLLSDCQT